MTSQPHTLPPETPRDVRLGLTKAKDVAFPLRWGFIGAGNGSRQWAGALKACDGATLAAVAARSKDKAEAFARQHAVEKSYDDYAEMVNSPDVDIVYIGTIDPFHKEHSLMALHAGKHVLCEKTLAPSIADAKEMYAAAEKNNVMLQDGVWTRYFPALEHARMLIESGAIGDVVMVQSDFETLYTTQAVTLGFGADELPSALKVVGKNAGGALMEFSDDKIAILSYINFGSEFRETTEFTGTLGRLTLEPGHAPTTLTVRIPPKVPHRYLGKNEPAPAQRFEYPLPESVDIPNADPNQEGYLYQAEAIHRCLAAGLLECPQYGKKESLYTLDLVLRIREIKPPQI